jgi:hypothetical protein
MKCSNKPTFMNNLIFNRIFSMPNSETFDMLPIQNLLSKYLVGCEVIIDPFARNSKIGTITNDLSHDTSAMYHMLAEEFVEKFKMDLALEADAVLFDPPYSPRQIMESYQAVGIKPTGKDTQNARLYKVVKDGLDKMLKPGGLAICCGWNSMGFGLTRGYELLEILLVPHGAAHNDTIVTVERKN